MTPQCNELQAKGKSLYQCALEEAGGILQMLSSLEDNLNTAAKWCLEAYASDRKIIALGNGGSACEAQHLVAELMGRYTSNRRPLAAVALSADTAIITCVANDFSFEDVFARQFEGLRQPGDLVIAFSTSGNSPNVLRTLQAARTLQNRSIAFLGRDGGLAAPFADCSLIVPHQNTARIQEGHNFLMHALMDQIEAELGIRP